MSPRRPKLLLICTLALCATITNGYALPHYTSSAHGNASYGVERLSSPYSTGNCAHCHSQHDSENFLLFAPNFSNKDAAPYQTSDSVCFACHSSSGGVTNNNYSATFGGATAESTSILDAFNQTSNHNLFDIKKYITGISGTKTFDNFPTGSNPCSGCHNVHLAEANKRFIINAIDPSLSALSRPTQHDTVWGDDTDELGNPTTVEKRSASSYQPPYYSGGTYLEPDGQSSDKVTQAAKTPDYDTFCIDCHNADNTITSSHLGTLKKFNWDLEAHGKGIAVDWTTTTEMKAPYIDAELGSYELSCLDCHEPHGSSNPYLIRKSINNNPVTFTTWNDVCISCHLAAGDLQTFHHKIKTDAGYACINCHYSSSPKSDPVLLRDCSTCHYHGSSVDPYKTF